MEKLEEVTMQRTKGKYYGRNSIIELLKGKSLGTKRAVFKALKDMLDARSRTSKVLALAKANGIKIKILS
jgi:hypothetical protein